MASEPKRNRIAKMRNVIAQRAGMALNGVYAGAHRDKRIARDFGVSVRMAQHLRVGQHWTIDRLAQASALLGAAFDYALYSPVSSAQHLSEMSEIAGRLARLEEWRGEMDRGGDAGLAPQTGGGGGVEERQRRDATAGVTMDNGGGAAPDQSAEVGRGVPPAGRPLATERRPVPRVPASNTDESERGR